MYRRKYQAVLNFDFDKGEIDQNIYINKTYMYVYTNKLLVKNL